MAALAMLVDEKKLSWDDRVIDKLPEFAFSDAYATHEMRIRDLTCHRSRLALGAGDLLFWTGTDLSASDILYRLRVVPLAGGYRAGFAYDNVLYDVIGAVVEKASGRPWQRLIMFPIGPNLSRCSRAVGLFVKSDRHSWRCGLSCALCGYLLALDKMSEMIKSPSSVDARHRRERCR